MTLAIKERVPTETSAIARTPAPDRPRVYQSAASRVQSTAGNLAIQRFAAGQTLRISQPTDAAELEADRVADQVMRMTANGGGSPLHVARGTSPAIHRCSNGEMCGPCARGECHTSDASVQRQATGSHVEAAPADVAPAGAGQPLSASVRAPFEAAFGHDFSHVRIRTDSPAQHSAADLASLAYTVGNSISFAAGQYAPSTLAGQRLLAHELTHVVQQGAAHRDRLPSNSVSQVAQTSVQRSLGDGHDLTSPRFSRLLDLEAAYDDESIIRKGDSGRGVQAIQQALYDIGFSLPASGADGQFGVETEAAVRAFQRRHPPLKVDGIVGVKTMTALDARFGAPVLPPSAVRSAPWSKDCVRSILCPWSPHTIHVLATRIELTSFDSISVPAEKWDGTAWISVPFPVAGYNTGVEIGVKNSSCERMAEVLYHEVLHAEQPSRHLTVQEKESYAYRIGEEFSIAMGLTGRRDLRSTDAQGRQFADQAAIEAFVAARYPGVPASGRRERIVGKASVLGHVNVQRSDGTFYTRPAVVGEKVVGNATPVNAVTHSRAGWRCP